MTQAINDRMETAGRPSGKPHPFRWEDPLDLESELTARAIMRKAG